MKMILVWKGSDTVNYADNPVFLPSVHDNYKAFARCHQRDVLANGDENSLLLLINLHTIR